LQVVAINRLADARLQYPASDDSLQGWYQILSQGEFKSEAELKSTFGDMRGFNHQFKFPIPESRLLVHTLINFETQIAYIEKIKPGNQ
jgi:mRNA-degrading endonuclease HigB of HigAB toxin-antitoxin module